MEANYFRRLTDEAQANPLCKSPDMTSPNLAQNVTPILTQEMRKWIRKRRLELNLSQQELAKELGITQGALSKLENRSPQTNPITLWRLAIALQVNPEDVIRCASD